MVTCCGAAALLSRANARLRKAFPGAGEGIRTHDPLITNQMLYQLSYASKFGPLPPSGQEKPSCSLPNVRDNFLNYHKGT